MTGEYTNTEPSKPETEQSSEVDLQRIRKVLAKIPLASQTEVAIEFKPVKKDPETGEYVPMINPNTNKPFAYPALLAVEDIDVCPVPLNILSDQELTDWLEGANEYRKEYIGDDPAKITAATNMGSMMLKQAAQKRMNSGSSTNE
ncbi:MAG: hypothetical protein JWN75_277 [Candidatus Saccharibacteria bacterium]|nr:hypothetical protein [Candidatus Saccharibacteria bacterium]